MKVKIVDNVMEEIYECEYSVGDKLADLIWKKGSNYAFGMCGGFCECATCFVTFDGDDKTQKEITDIEMDMMKTYIPTDIKGRLSCQMLLSSENDGDVFYINGE